MKGSVYEPMLQIIVACQFKIVFIFPTLMEIQ